MDKPVAEYWTLKGPDRRVLRCVLVRGAGGLEVHAENGDPPRREKVLSERDALNVAEAWKALFEAHGWVPSDDPREQSATTTDFKIDRSQRIHCDGVVVRVYQVVGAIQYGWDTNREAPPSDRPLYESRAAAEEAADDALFVGGHLCTVSCYVWRALM